MRFWGDKQDCLVRENLPNTACTPLRQAQGGLVGVCAFLGSLRGLKWVPSKRRSLVPGERRDGAQSRPPEACGA